MIRAMRFTGVLIIGLLISAMGRTQETGIKGSVKTSDNNPAQFVNVYIKGTSKGAVTNEKGEYSIKDVTPGDHILIAALVGLEKQEKKVVIKAGEMLVVDLVLPASNKELKELVIISKSETYYTDKPSGSLRIKTPLIEMPQNVQVITKSTLDDQQAFDMLDGIQRNVSGAQKVEHWDNYARINMRGSQITPFRNGMNVHLSPWSPLTEDMSMVERIEFVKGPAGFMLASGEPGGFYNVVTKKPTGFRKGEATFSLGSYDFYRVSTDLDGKLSENGKVLYRLNVMGQLKGSHRDFEYNNRYSFAPVIKYVMSESSALTLEYNEQYSQMNVIGSNYAFSSKGYADLPVNFTTAEPNLDPTEMHDRSVLAIFEHDLNKDWTFTAQMGYLNFKQTGQSIWPYGISIYNDSLMQRGISIWDALGTNKNGQIYVNGNVKTGKITHKVLAGIDMSNKDYFADWSQGAPLGDSTFNIYDPVYGTLSASEIPEWNRDQDIRVRGVRYTNSYAGYYLQDEIGFFDNRVRLTLAGRYTTIAYINPYEGTTNDSKATPRVGLSWSIDKNTSLYAVYDQAFLANTGTDWQGNNFDPLTGENLELGIKRNWFSNKWFTGISVYQITKNNILTTDIEHPDPLTGQFIYSRQTGQQQVQGVEFDARGELINGLDLVVNYAYTDAKITSDSDPSIVGNAVPGATKHIQNTWLSYRFNNEYLRGFKIATGYQYQAGRSSWFIFDNSENALPDYFRLDASIGYSKDNFRINLVVNNLLDEYLYSGAPYSSLFYWQTEAPRNFRLSIGYKF